MAIFKHGVFLAALLSVTMACAQAAHADPDKSAEKEESYCQQNGKYTQRFNIRDRGVIRSYLADRYASSCPPELAGRHNGCLPPSGPGRKTYLLGYPLKQETAYEFAPQSLLVLLKPVPEGYQYVIVDKDMLLVSEATHTVIDTVTYRSAIGQ